MFDQIVYTIRLRRLLFDYKIWVIVSKNQFLYMLLKGPNRNFSWHFKSTLLRHLFYNQLYVLDIYFGVTFSKRHLFYNQLYVLDIYFGATFSKRHSFYNHLYVLDIYFGAAFSKCHLFYNQLYVLDIYFGAPSLNAIYFITSCAFWTFTLEPLSLNAICPICLKWL